MYCYSVIFGPIDFHRYKILISNEDGFDYWVKSNGIYIPYLNILKDIFKNYQQKGYNHQAFEFTFNGEIIIIEIRKYLIY